MLFCVNDSKLHELLTNMFEMCTVAQYGTVMNSDVSIFLRVPFQSCLGCTIMGGEKALMCRLYWHLLS